MFPESTFLIYTCTRFHGQEVDATYNKVRLRARSIGRIQSKCAPSERDRLAESGVGVLGLESDHTGPHTRSGNGLWRFFHSFHRIFARYAYILRTTPLFCSIGPALLGLHRLLALNPDSSIDDTLTIQVHTLKQYDNNLLTFPGFDPLYKINVLACVCMCGFCFQSQYVTDLLEVSSKEHGMASNFVSVSYRVIHLAHTRTCVRTHSPSA